MNKIYYLNELKKSIFVSSSPEYILSNRDLETEFKVNFLILTF